MEFPAKPGPIKPGERKLKITTACSGTDAPVVALQHVYGLDNV